jgi:uncharacterized protein YuzE
MEAAQLYLFYCFLISSILKSGKTVDFGEVVGDLFVRFRHGDSAEGEATADGKVIVHNDTKGKIAAVEITDLTGF